MPPVIQARLFDLQWTGSVFLFTFFKALGCPEWWIKSVLHLKSPSALPHNIKLKRSLNTPWNLEPTSRFWNEVLDGIRFQYRPVSSALHTCFSEYPSSSMIVSNYEGKSSVAGWFALAASPLNFMLWRLYRLRNFSNQPLLAEKSRTSWMPSSFCKWWIMFKAISLIIPPSTRMCFGCWWNYSGCVAQFNVHFLRL